MLYIEDTQLISITVIVTPNNGIIHKGLIN